MVLASTLSDAGGVVAIVVGAIAILSASGLIVRGSILKATNDTLDDGLRVERDARAEDNRRCAAEIAELRGRIAILTTSFAAAVGREVADVVVGRLRDDGVIK